MPTIPKFLADGEVPEFQIIRLTPREVRGGVPGVFYAYNAPRFVTLERPWNDNHAYNPEAVSETSCIPEGIYTCKETLNRTVGSTIIPRTFEICDVPNRKGILFHAGNYVRDTHGCILIGTSFSVCPLHENAIWKSSVAFTEFLRLLKHIKQFTLKIVWSNQTENTPSLLKKFGEAKVPPPKS